MQLLIMIVFLLAVSVADEDDRDNNGDVHAHLGYQFVLSFFFSSFKIDAIAASFLSLSQLYFLFW